LCLLVKSVAEDQRIITVSADRDSIQDALVCNPYMYVHLGYRPIMRSRWLDIARSDHMAGQRGLE